MGDYYTEQLIKRKSKIKLKVGLLAVTLALYLLAYFVVAYAIIPATILTIADIIIFRRMKIEYEYLYVNGDLDIDKIFNKQSRKNMFETNMKDLVVIAPVGHQELKKYANVKGQDFTSGYKDRKIYEMVIQEKGVYYKIVFEPNNVILEGIERIAPRKVFD